MSTQDRFENEPLVKLLELYVLWSIGELPKVEEQSLGRILPQLRSTLAKTLAGQQLDVTSLSWQRVIATAMSFPDNMAAEIRKIWLANLEIARRSNAILTPQEFAQMFVAENFRDDDDDDDDNRP
jgi:hypothetical protein